MSNLSIYRITDKNGAFFIYVPRDALNDLRVQKFIKYLEATIILCETAGITQYGFFYDQFNSGGLDVLLKTYISFTQIKIIEEIIFNKQEDKHD